MPGKIDWIVTTSGRPIRDVTRELEAAGFTVKQVLEEIGAVVGAADESAVEKLRSVRGVADVSKDQQVDVGPPGSKKTW